MKKIVLLIAFILFLADVYSQSTLVFAPDSSKWSQHYGRECGGGGSSYFYDTTNYILHGDTIVNNKRYQMLYSAGTGAKIDTVCYSFIRYIYNDSGLIYIGKKIDSLNPVYNFNLIKGDSFPILAYNNATYQVQIFYPKVDSIKTLFYAGKNRKWIRFKQLPVNYTMWSATPTWVEGIGDINYGLIFDYVQITNGNVGPCTPMSSYDCFYDGGNKSVVGNCLYGNCYQSGIKGYANNTQFSIKPNPASNTIQVTVNNEQVTETKIVDVLGDEVLSTKEKEIDISSLANGVYLVQVKTNEGITSKKIIIQH